MKLIRKNKRGAAMESAVLFMLIALMLGMLLTGVAMLTHLRVKLNNTMLTREIKIEQIGNDFVHGTLKFENLQVGEQSIEVEGAGTVNYNAFVNYTDYNNKSLALYTKNDTLLLQITVENGKIISWKYTE